MSDFSPSNFLSELYNKHYLTYLTGNPRARNYKYTNEWCFEGTVLGFVQNQLAFRGDKINIENNYKKHYELLRLIIYECCKYYRYNSKNYIEFIKDILWILLEQEGISLAHKVPNTENLHSLLSKPLLIDIFNDETDNLIKISNTSVHNLLSNINEDKCQAIEKHIASISLKRRAYFDDSQTNPTILPNQTNPTNQLRSFKKYKITDTTTGGKKTKRRRSKKSKNIKKTKKYKKTKKFNKSKKTKKTKK